MLSGIAPWQVKTIDKVRVNFLTESDDELQSMELDAYKGQPIRLARYWNVSNPSLASLATRGCTLTSIVTDMASVSHDIGAGWDVDEIRHMVRRLLAKK